MTTYFISRHAGAVEWAKRQDLQICRFVSHLDIADVRSGDIVIGSLPVDLAAQVCASSAAYWHLSLDMPAELRGLELSADELEWLGAHIQPYDVKAIHQRNAQLPRMKCNRHAPL